MAGLLPTQEILGRPTREALTAPAPSTQRTLRFAAEWHAAEVVTVASIAGEVDATNVDAFLHYILGELLLCRGLVLDLTNVTFFSSEGYRSLVTLASRCATADVSWVLVPSSSVRRILRICDVTQRLPVAESISQGLVEISEPRPEPASGRCYPGGSAACNPRRVPKGRVVVASGD
jgi:anti-anti-sigma factor